MHTADVGDGMQLRSDRVRHEYLMVPDKREVAGDRQFQGFPTRGYEDSGSTQDVYAAVIFAVVVTVNGV